MSKPLGPDIENRRDQTLRYLEEDLVRSKEQLQCGIAAILTMLILVGIGSGTMWCASDHEFSLLGLVGFFVVALGLIGVVVGISDTYRAYKEVRGVIEAIRRAS